MNIARWIAFVVALVALGTGSGHAQTGSYPSQRVHIIVGFPPGGGVDIVARLVADKLTPMFGQPVVVENRPGAGTSIATRYVAGAKPDGYTLLMNSNSMVANQVINPNAGYDIERELVPVLKAAVQPNIIVAAADLPAKTLKDVIELSKRQDITYGSPGAGSIPHLAAEHLFTALAGARLRHIPYPGAAPALTSALGGQVSLVVVTAPPAVPHVKAGKLKGIAVTTAKRMAALPQVPTVIESGYPGFVIETWAGFFAPAATPPAVLQALSGAMLKTLAMPEVKERLASLGFEPADLTTEPFRREISGELKQVAEIVKKANLKF
jgi:tripartite-type tricarboxylate transporter receptor subunit TctC